MWNSDNIILQNQTGDPTKTANSDNQAAPSLGGRQGEDYVSEIHGKAYTAGYRGATFIATTLIAGTIIPISTATAATFGLYNPPGSGKNLELISYEASLLAATVVVASIELTLIPGVGAGAAALPSGVTILTPTSNPVGGPGGLPVATAFSAATVTASTRMYALGLSFGTTTENAGPVSISYFFDGRLIIAPGTVVHVTGNAAQTSAALQQFVWAEWPI